MCTLVGNIKFQFCKMNSISSIREARIFMDCGLESGKSGLSRGK